MKVMDWVDSKNYPLMYYIIEFSLGADRVNEGALQEKMRKKPRTKYCCLIRSKDQADSLCSYCSDDSRMHLHYRERPTF